MHNAVNLIAQFARIRDAWSPRVVGELNGGHVKLVKLQRDKSRWLRHETEDELFLVFEGTIEIQFRDVVVSVGPWELFIVPRGTEHRVIPLGEVKAVLLSPAR